jgi:hypothetical protein
MGGGTDDDGRMQADVEKLKNRAIRNRMDFLRTELGLSFTFVDLADTHYKAGASEKAHGSIVSAEMAYSTMLRFMSDPEYANSISREERQELTAGLENLRKRLDGPKPSHP